MDVPNIDEGVAGARGQDGGAPWIPLQGRNCARVSRKGVESGCLLFGPAERSRIPNSNGIVSRPSC
eukprot:scaffold2285_cov380-Prasinococcus_capsulatus_cf.AAC.12